MPTPIYTSAITAPFGDLCLGDFQDKLCFVSFGSSQSISDTMLRIRHILGTNFMEKETLLLREAKSQLAEHFARRRQHFNLPLLLSGTDFQKSVWEAMRTIPYGARLSYQDIAVKIKRPKSVRAVGNACGANALPIIIPCHRIVNKNGKWGGYNGGLRIKRFLLGLEL